MSLSLAGADARLGSKVPQVLRSLYESVDGVFDNDGQWWVVWPLDRVVEDNLLRWSTGALRREFLAFGDDGTGNPFCIRLSGADEILRWSDIDREVELSEGTLAHFLATWAPAVSLP